MANKKFQNDKLLVKTPKGQIVQRFYTKGQNKGSVYARIEWNDGFGAKRTEIFQNAQGYVDSEVLRLSGPYTPKQTGMLIASGQLGTVIGSGEVIWCSPYAAAQYWNTSESRSYDAQRGSKWFERMKIDHGKQIINGAKKIGGGK
ncbi:MAG: hypothetical protein RR635_07545 [Oscillospiraceae bacterium]